jgi:acetyl-CoA acetyltransferase family protein
MPDVVVLSAVRTPIARSHRGSLIHHSIFELGNIVVAESLKRSGVEPADVDDVVLGEVIKGGGCTARHVVVELGLPAHIPGVAVNRQCATSLTAVSMAAAGVAAGMDRVAVAGGVENVTQAPMVFRPSPVPYGRMEQWVPPGHPPTDDAPGVMGILVGENTADECGITREEQDAWAVMSHARAIAAIDAGRFVDEIVPVTVPDGAGGTRLFDTDEHPRRDTTLESLAKLRPAFKPGGTVTAGNSSGVNDAACALVLASSEYAAAHGLTPMATIKAWAAGGVEPRLTGLAPTVVLPKALARAGMTIADLDLVELNEAFASMAVACTRLLELDPEKVNVNGGAVGLGHPIGASGARILTTLIHELARRGGGAGAATMCAGGGMGGAVVVEVPGR